MSGLAIGFFGKLPSHGDFLQRGVSDAFREPWDEWLQRCLAASRATLHERWADVYLTSPVWRFFVSEGLIGGASFGGLVIPSVDKVGRCFPLTIVAELPSKIEPLSFAQAADAWLCEVEELSIEALRSDTFDLRHFEDALAASAARLSEVTVRSDPVKFPSVATHWRCSISSTRALAPPLARLSIDAARLALLPMSLWWTDGSHLVRPSALMVRALPEPDAFVAMLAGTWAEAGWTGDIAVEEDSAAGQPNSVSLRSAAATSMGTARNVNQDAFMCSDHTCLWAVADGIGGGHRGEVASRMVADALAALEPGAASGATMQSVRAALQRVNSELYRGNANQRSGGTSGSTISALALCGIEWSVAWAGDSRAYLYRGGDLIQLTSDHSLRNHPSVRGCAPDGVAVHDGVITRAVGGEAELRLDEVGGKVCIGDRFLLCTDGVHGVLKPTTLALALAINDTAMAAREVLEAALAAGASDDATAVVIDVGAEG